MRSMNLTGKNNILLNQNEMPILYMYFLFNMCSIKKWAFGVDVTVTLIVIVIAGAHSAAQRCDYCCGIQPFCQ